MDIQIKQSSAVIPLQFLMTLSSDNITGATGLSPLPTVTISKNGASKIVPSGAISESPSGDGIYQIAPNAIDTNTLGTLRIHATASGCGPSDTYYQVVAYDPLETIGEQLLNDAFGSYSAGTIGALLNNLSFITSTTTILTVAGLIYNGSVFPIFRGNSFSYTLLIPVSRYNLADPDTIVGFGMTILPKNNNPGLSPIQWDSYSEPTNVIVNNAGESNQSITIVGTASDTSELALSIRGFYPAAQGAQPSTQYAYSWTVSISSDEYGFCDPAAQGFVDVIFSDSVCSSGSGSTL